MMIVAHLAIQGSYCHHFESVIFKLTNLIFSLKLWHLCEPNVAMYIKSYIKVPYYVLIHKKSSCLNITLSFSTHVIYTKLVRNNLLEEGLFYKYISSAKEKTWPTE